MQLNNILITGGAGYIGSHIVKALLKAQATRLVVLDNLSTGFADSVPIDAKFIQGDIQDITLLSKIMKAEKIRTVIHLAAATIIPESLEHPLKYYQNNTMGTLNLLVSCLKNNVEYFIYSSTAAVYSPIAQETINELCPTDPLNPYGYSKFMSEQIVKDVSVSHGLKYVILRYFNVAGASPDGSIGQSTSNATHLIKVAVRTACGLQKNLPIYGVDYPTFDGTCIRDFIHVSDLSHAHIKALEYLQAGGESVTLNCGYGRGYSVKDVIDTVEKITNKKLPVIIAPARQGDIAKVVADPTKIKQLLNWQPQFDDLALIVSSAFNWEKKLIECV